MGDGAFARISRLDPRGGRMARGRAETDRSPARGEPAAGSVISTRRSARARDAIDNIFTRTGDGRPPKVERGAASLRCGCGRPEFAVSRGSDFRRSRNIAGTGTFG